MPVTALGEEITLGLRGAAERVPAGAVTAVEPVLVEQAPALAPGDIRGLLGRTLQALAPGALLDREEQASDRRAARLSPLGDGWALSGDPTPEAGAALEAVLRSLMRAQPAPPDGQQRPTVAQRRHDALHTLARGVLDAGGLPEERPEPADESGRGAGHSAHSGAAGGPAQETQGSAGRSEARLSDTGGERPHLLVIADLALLQSPPPAPRALAGGGTRTDWSGWSGWSGWSAGPVPAAELHGSGPVSPDLARRLACDASVTRVITHRRPRTGAPTGPPGADPPGLALDVHAVRALLPPALGGPVSQVLDVGRRARTVPPATRRAVLARDRGCRWPGCAAPMSRGEVHHIQHWADGGATDLPNLLLLCWAHHRLLHEGGWHLRLHTDGTVTLQHPAEAPHHRRAA